MPKPDVVLIILDTTRRDRLSIYGNKSNTSPHFDDFASRATLYDRAVSPAQWTIPAHASLFTGTYASTHQLIEADRTLSGAYPTLAEILRADGYHTAGFCNNPLVGVLNNGLQRGFDAFYNYAGAAPNRPQDMRRSGIRRMVERRWGRFARNVGNKFAHSDALFQISMHPLLVPIWTRSINYTGHTAHSISDSLEYLQTRRKTHPETSNFTFLNLMGAHLPYHPPPEFLPAEIRNDKAAWRFMRRFNTEAARWATPDEPPLSDWQKHVIDGFYQAEIAHQDAHLGRLLRYLQTLDDTLVIIAADHGEGHGDHGFFGHSFVVYQELVHVPLMIHYPERFPQGARIAKNVSTRRIFHTIMDATGITPPLDEADPNADVAGLSLARSLNGTADKDGEFVFAEAFPPQTVVNLIHKRTPELLERLQLRQTRRGVYAGEHKLALIGDSVDGLFDVSTDPAEMQNVADNQPDTVRDLQATVAEFVKTAEHYRAGGLAYGTVSAEVEDNLRALGYIE
ncbi:MAG: sulfatase [Aggregatilineales bacterium]